MYKKISKMTALDKAEFFEKIKQAMVKEQGISREIVEERITKEIENIFYDEKFVKMDSEFRIDAAYARKEFGDHKPELVDYLLWSLKFITKSDYDEL